MSKPRTKAGRVLLDHIGWVAWFDEETEYADLIIAIENEAETLGRRSMDEALRLHAESPEHYPAATPDQGKGEPR